MPLITTLQESKKEKLTIQINADVLNNINKYCKWAQVNDIGFFLEEAAKFVFKKDKDYKNSFKTSNRGRKKLSQTESV